MIHQGSKQRGVFRQQANGWRLSVYIPGVANQASLHDLLMEENLTL